ncbi:hypothetical protein OVA14_04465 [Agrococcus sp. SL85]|uniref:hypothetical protein n=1 Tax=Agrococcus sp. SL85 TaxID=2995141 RepID=UPI00226CE854|nr:hypothetical protein [Agrococcus sp. SL85]WAC67020.1 hypothetical protein OVA14_04465 [Agrococcus sp. SL85]
MPPLVILGIGLMVACMLVSGFDAVRTMRHGREPERRIRAFLLAAGLLVAGGICVAVGSATA